MFSQYLFSFFIAFCLTQFQSLQTITNSDFFKKNPVRAERAPDRSNLVLSFIRPLAVQNRRKLKKFIIIIKYKQPSTTIFELLPSHSFSSNSFNLPVDSIIRRIIFLVLFRFEGYLNPPCCATGTQSIVRFFVLILHGGTVLTYTRQKINIQSTRIHSTIPSLHTPCHHLPSLLLPGTNNSSFVPLVILGIAKTEQQQQQTVPYRGNRNVSQANNGINTSK